MVKPHNTVLCVSYRWSRWSKSSPESGVLKEYTSSTSIEKLYVPVGSAVLISMLLARLSVCPCQVQVPSQVSAKLLRVTNVPCIDVRQSEDKANRDWLTGEANNEHFLSYQFVYAFESVTLRKPQWHKRGFPVLLGCPVAIASPRFSLETGIGG